MAEVTDTGLRKLREHREAVLIVGILLATLAASLLAVATRSAEAAFQGANGAIAYTSGDAIGANLDVYRIDPDGFQPTNLTPETTGTDESQPAWSSEGTWIAFVSTDNSQGTPGSEQEIWRMRASGRKPDGTGASQLTDNAVLDLEPSWFPTDTKIAFRRNEPSPSTEAHIWVLRLDADGNFVRETQLTSGSSSNIQPAVSPDGKKIAFASDRDGDYDIYVMKAAREGLRNVPEKLTRNAVLEWNPDWSPDGRRITFECERGGTDKEICVMNADGTQLEQLTSNTFADQDPVFSPDGKRISFERDLGGSNRDIWRMRADGANPYNVTDDGTTRIDANPSWQAR